MYIPIEIWQPVYVFDQFSLYTLRKWKVLKIEVSDDNGIVVEVDAQFDERRTVRFPLHKVYPSEKVAIEELRRFAIERLDDWIYK